ncbi:hypothetical protein EB796_023295 [Bugula neritina]|uniref:Neurotransmitter-gated ion-channel ligand-binding domain-containing protein n=1 Tax=Bugula neritina TaxID=10212 RepID=A0A7J7IX07_BUGNE|nr:hypothetical protein EB796_023295 [Bugula neritina]
MTLTQSHYQQCHQLTIELTTAHLNSANSSYAKLCRNQQFNNTGRPTTPPYTRLVNTVHQKLEQILNADSKQWPEQLINLENEVLELNNDLLPGRILEELCFLLTLIAAADNTENSDALLKTKVVEFRNSTNEILDNYDYTAHRLRKSDEQRLLSELMTNYERDVRPVLKASEPVELKIGLTLNQIDVDEKNQVLTVLVWLDQEWIDEKLIWDPANYSGLTVLRIPCSLTWLPDIVLYNSVEDLREGYMQALTMVEHNGNVFWPPIVKYRGNCEIKIKYFPYDDQECRLKLGSWAYDGFQVNLTKRKMALTFQIIRRMGSGRSRELKL